MKKVSFIDLFCGIGGFRYALDAAGYNCVFSSDIDKDARATYQANFGTIPDGDITAIPPRNIPPHGLTDLKNIPEVILAASTNTSIASNATGLFESSTDTLPPLTVTLLSAKPIAENVAVVGTDAVKVKLPSLLLVVPKPFERMIFASATGLLSPSVTTPETVV